MSLQGRVKNGVVVFKNGDILPEGTAVTVRPMKQPGAKATSRSAESPGRRKLLRHAGKDKGLPTDAARNLDHYHFGHGKK